MYCASARAHGLEGGRMPWLDWSTSPRHAHMRALAHAYPYVVTQTPSRMHPHTSAHLTPVTPCVRARRSSLSLPFAFLFSVLQRERAGVHVLRRHHPVDAPWLKCVQPPRPAPTCTADKRRERHSHIRPPPCGLPPPPPPPSLLFADSLNDMVLLSSQFGYGKVRAALTARCPCCTPTPFPLRPTHKHAHSDTILRTCPVALLLPPCAAGVALHFSRSVPARPARLTFPLRSTHTPLHAPPFLPLRSPPPPCRRLFPTP
jgi:hypothetical protein